MSDHIFPVNGGVKITLGTHTIGVWAEETPIGAAIFLGYDDPSSGWLGVWNHGPMPDSQMQQEITTAGGIVPYVNSFASAINAAIAQIYGTAPPPTVTVVDQINAALAASFALVAGNGVPVFGQKA